MPVSDQLKARQKETKSSGKTEANSQSSPSPDQTAEAPTGPLSPGRTKGLAGFWATQNDEVKVSRKKRLEAVETPATETVVENTPQKLDGVVRAEDPGSWARSDEIAVGRTRNVASTFQQQQSAAVPQTQDDVRRTKRSVSETTKTATQQPDVVTKRSSATVVLAENDPQQLNPDVVRSSEGSSWDDVAELQAGRTRNLLQHWKSTEEDAAQPKTSTTRYQGGAKPAWILEIEEARATSSGAIGQAEAWARQDQEQQEVEENRNIDEVGEQRVAAADSNEIVDEAVEQTTQDAVTSQQTPVSDVDNDVILPPSVVDDLCDVSVDSSLPQGHVTPPTPGNEHQLTHVTHEAPHSETTQVNADVSPAALRDLDHDLVTSRSADVTESPPRPTATEDSVNVITEPPQQHITSPPQPDRRTDVDRPTEAPPVTSSASPATVARQQTTPVDTVDDGRSKKRHKDDKNKTNPPSAEHRHRRWCSLM